MCKDMEKPKMRNPFDLITEDKEVGERVPLGEVRAKKRKKKSESVTYSGVNGDEILIKF